MAAIGGHKRTFNLMDKSQVDFFVSRYKTMSDEHLTNVLIDRHDHLSEEANEVLTRVLDEKPDKAAFDREIRAKVDDLNAQAHAAKIEVARHEAHQRRARRAFRTSLMAADVGPTLSWSNHISRKVLMSLKRPRVVGHIELGLSASRWQRRQVLWVMTST